MQRPLGFDLSCGRQEIGTLVVQTLMLQHVNMLWENFIIFVYEHVVCIHVFHCFVIVFPKPLRLAHDYLLCVLAQSC